MARATAAKKTKKTKKTATTKRATKKLPKRSKAKKKKKPVKAKKKVAKKKTAKKTTKKKTTKKKTLGKKKSPTKKKTKKTTNKKPAKVKKATKTAKSKVVALKPAKPKLKLVEETAFKLNVGDMAPDFSLRDQHGNMTSLNQFRGKKVVLYFYPKDDTPGCTREACSFRDHLAQFQGLNAEIIGVSFDDQSSHEKFIEKYSLNFTLLSDENKEVANQYGVYVEKNMYGKTYMGIERSTLVIDSEGKISQIFRRVKVDGHTEEVIKALESAS